MSSDSEDDEKLCMWCKELRHEGVCISSPLYVGPPMTDKLSQAMERLKDISTDMRKDRVVEWTDRSLLNVWAARLDQIAFDLSAAQPDSTEPSPTSAEVFAQCEKLRGKHYHVEPTDRESIDMLVTLVNQRNNDKAAEIEAAQPPHAEEAGIDLSVFDGFTPGPWLLERLSGDFTYGVRVSGDCVSGYTALLRMDWPHADQRAELEANARLIAAAPLLLAELRRVREGLLSDLQQARAERDAWRDAVYICPMSSDVLEAVKWMCAYAEERMRRASTPLLVPRYFFVRLLNGCDDGFAHLTREEADRNALPYNGTVIPVAEVLP